MRLTLRKLLVWGVCAFVLGLGVGYGLVEALVERTTTTHSAAQAP